MVAQRAHPRAEHGAWAFCLPAQQGSSPLPHSPGEQNQPLAVSLGCGREPGARGWTSVPLREAATEGSLGYLRASAVSAGEEGQLERVLVA